MELCYLEMVPLLIKMDKSLLMFLSVSSLSCDFASQGSGSVSTKNSRIRMIVDLSQVNHGRTFEK